MSLQGNPSQLPKSSRPPGRQVKNPSSNSKRYRIELGTGEWAKEALEKWQGSLQRYDNNIELLHRALNLLKSTAARDRQVFGIFVYVSKEL